MNKLITIAALGLALPAAALAQSDTTATTVEGGVATQTQPSHGDWTPDVVMAFYTDESGQILRTEDEIKANFEALSADSQAVVRANCRTVLAATPTPPSPNPGNDAAAGTEGSATTQSGPTPQTADSTGEAPAEADTEATAAVGAAVGTEGAPATQSGEAPASEEAAGTSSAGATIVLANLVQICSLIPAQ